MRRSLPAMLLFASGLAWAQVPNSTLPSPRITSLFPSGGQSGTEFEVIVRGTDLDDPGALRFSHPGLRAEIVSHPEPAKKDPNTKGMKNKATPTEARFRITVGKDVPPGIHEVRLTGKFGISNPRAFSVGTQPEVKEIEPNNDVPQGHKIAINSIVNGVIEAQTDVDYFQFTGKAGQRVLAHCAASSIDSRARPLVEIFASDGRSRIGLNRNYSGNDALCDVTLPSNGDYYIRITEFAYTAGGADYFYRFTLHDGPWLDAIYPPVIAAGQTATVTLFGRNLPGGQPTLSTTITAPGQGNGFQGLLNLPQACGLAEGFAATPQGLNPLPMFFAKAPVVLEATDPNDTPEKAQAITTPCEVVGRIETKNDRDCFRFAAKKGQTVIIDLAAERLGSVQDMVLGVYDDNGKALSGDTNLLDDDPDAIHPISFFNRTTDPAPFRFTPPEDGTYTVIVSARDANSNYGPRSIYRLRIAPPKPDFRVVAMARHRELPTGINVTPAGETAIDFFVQRIDGFTAPVKIQITNLPAGVTASPLMIGTGQRWGLLILNATGAIQSQEVLAKMEAIASVDGQEMRRAVASASIIWGVPNAQNVPTYSRLDRGLIVATRAGEKLPFRIVAQLDKLIIKGADGKERPAGKPLLVKNGDSIDIPVRVLWQSEGSRANNVTIDAEATASIDRNGNPIRAASGQGAVFNKDKADGIVTLRVRENGPPGDYMVHLRGDTKASMITDMATKQKKEYTLVSYAEPFALTIVPTTLGKVSGGNMTIKLGKTDSMTVRVERAFDFPGEFKLKLNFPEKSGISADDVIIPAGANDVKVPVRVSADAKTGNVKCTIQHSATFDGKFTVNGEATTNLTVTK